jgi:hypothetical protein
LPALFAHIACGSATVPELSQLVDIVFERQVYDPRERATHPMGRTERVRLIGSQAP